MSAVFESDRDEVAPGRSLALMPEWYPRRPSAARMDPVRAGGRVRRLGTTLQGTDGCVRGVIDVGVAYLTL